MLIIFLLVVLILVAFTTFKSYRSKQAFKMLISLLFIWIIAETVAYGYLLHKILLRKDNNFYLIGNQFILDKLLYKQVYDKYMRVTDGVYGPSQDTGYGLLTDVFIGDERQTTSDGFRGTHNYAVDPSKDKLRIVAIGDSYVFCDGELIKNCWTHQLESRIGGLEVLNFGVSGFGMGQSYVRLVKSALKYKPDIVYLNYINTTVRDGIVPGVFLQGVNLNKSPYYRVEFRLTEEGFDYYSFSALSLFDPKIRDEVIYKRLGIDPKKEIWFNPFFSFSNIGVMIKEKFAPLYYLNKYESKEERRLELNLRILRSLYKLAVDNDFTLVIFARERVKDLDPSILKLLNTYQDRIVFISWPDLYYPMILSEWQKQGVFSTVNETEHFNAVGNLFYADLVGSFLKSRSWKSHGRAFQYNKERNAFIRF
jgi:hypothetical protein